MKSIIPHVLLAGLMFKAAIVLAAAPDAPMPDPTGINKVRFVSMRFPSPPAGQPPETALRVWLTSLHHVDPPYAGAPTRSFSVFEGQSVWVGPPSVYVESQFSGIPFRASFTQCTPHYRDWTVIGPDPNGTQQTLHVTGSHIVPDSIYHVEQVPIECQGIEDACGTVSPALEVRTSRWADTEIPYRPPSLTAQPDFGDCASVLNKFRDVPGAPFKVRTFLSGNMYGVITTLHLDISFSHIASSVDAFRGQGYIGRMGTCGIGACNSDDPDVPDAPCVTSADCKAAGQPGPCSVGPACYDDADCGENGPCRLYCPD